MTSYCNFDMSEDFDSSVSKAESDCYEYCTVDLGCAASNLGNGLCDESCSSAECGYDWGDCGYCANNCFQNSLENDSCDPSCNTSSCFFDINVCAECAPGCSQDLFENEECDQDCQNCACNYDNQRCSMTENLCSEGCLDYMKQDGKCDSECNNTSCDYDEGDCYCASGCFKTTSDGECNTECQYNECKFDFGDCGYCSIDCFTSDLGDGICKSECFTSDCEWDQGDCQCSQHCFFQDLGQCKPECLNPDCKYDEFPDMPQCEDAALKHLAIYTHVIHSNFTREVNLEECLQTGCTIEELSSALEPCSEDCCISNCADKACAFHLGRCASKECGEDCEICEDSCLQCNSDKFQFLGNCYSECPVGTEPQYFTFFDYDKFCVPFLETSSVESPKQYYVDIRTDGSYGRGTSEDPFSSLSIALSSIYTEYSEIVLMSEGPFELAKTPEDYPLKSLLEDEANPLSKSEFIPKSISIISSVTENYATLSIPKPSELMVFEVKCDLKMSNIVIEGTKIFPECTGDIYCDYCPMTYIIGDVILNDKDEILEEGEYFTGCSDYHWKDLFLVKREGNLFLKNVKFENLRMELYSLIRSRGGNVQLENVEFKNIRTMAFYYSFPIVFEGCSENYNCGDFSYVNGTVSLLNNGYELSVADEFTGFLHVSYARNILLESISFSYNFVTSDNDIQYSLITAEIFYTFQMRNCDFKQNLLTDGIVYINARNLEFEYSLDENGRVEQLLVNHVMIENITIDDSYNIRRPFIYLLYKNTLQNIYFDNIHFKNNFCYLEGIVVSNEKVQDEYKENLIMPVEINGIKTTAYHAKRTAYFNDITFYNNNIGHNGALSLYGMINVKFQNLSMTSNIANDNTVNVILKQYSENPVVYSEEEFELTSTLDCRYMMLFSNCYNLEIDSSLFHNNYCKESTPALEIVDQDTFRMTNTVFSQNIGNLEYGPTCLTLGGFSIFLIENSVFFSNKNNLGPGLIEAIGDQLDLEIISSVFSENHSATGPELQINTASLSMNNVTLHKNINLYASSGGLVFESHSVITHLKIVDCLFTENETLQGRDATITLLGDSSPEHTILMEVSGTNFTYNKAATYGSVFYATDSVYLDPLSYFENCTFSHNEVGLASNIILDQRGGGVEFRNCTFSENVSAGGNGSSAVMLFRTLGENAFVHISDSVISRNRGSSMIHYAHDISYKTLVTRNCEFSLNEGNALYLEYCIWEDFNSIFDSNHRIDGGSAFLIREDTVANLTGSHFTSNSGNSGGAGIVRMNSIIFLDQCVFSYNSVETMGGAIYAEQDSEVIILNSEFYGNSAESGSAIMALACDQVPIIIHGCVFYENNASQEGTIMIQIGDLVINNSEMYGNIAATGSSGISITTGNAVIENSDFHDQVSPLGTYLYSNTYSVVSIDSCSFRSGRTAGSGGALYATFTNLTVTSCTFENLEASFGGAIHLYYNSQLNLQSTTFTDIKTTNEGGNVSCFESDLYISECKFLNYSESAVFLDNTFDVEVHSSSFVSGTARDGGGINCKSCNSLIVQNSTFAGLYANQGGAIFLYSSTGTTTETVQISNSNFTRNQAQKGGAIYSNNLKLAIETSVFDSNSANDSIEDGLIEVIENGKGGAVLLLCKEVNDCEFSVINSSFVNNNATYNGGAICWEDVMPALSSGSFVANHALYGSDISSFPIKVMEVDSSGQLIQYTRRLQDTPVAGAASSVASGQAIPSIAFAVVDHYDHIVTTDNLNTLTVSGSEGVSVSGTTQVSSVKGIANFTDLIVSAEPGTSVSISVAADGIDVDKAETANDGLTYYSRVNINIELRECQPGEATVGVECQVCEEGKYSLSPTDTTCRNCPDSKAFCYGGSEMAPKPKYWRSSKYSSYFWECPNPDACKGGEISGNLTISYTGRCAKGYKGNMCQSCDVGHSRGASDSCQICPDDDENVVILLIIFCIVVCMLVIMVKTTIDSAYKTTALHSVYIKIFINYLQLVILTASLNLEWPELVLKLFSIHQKTGTVTDQVFSFDCYLDSEDNPDSVYFEKLIILSLMPIIVGFVTVVIWAMISAYKRKWNYMKDELVATLVILLFLIHPTIIKVMFSSMNCIEIEVGEFWLKDNLDIQCWDSTHIFFVTTTSLPSIIIWGILVPAFCLLILAKNKRKLNSLAIRKKFGFLFNGYTSSGYYWEFVILYRKIIIICCSVFIGNVSIPVQALTVMLILIISLIIQYKFRPYSEPILNRIEVRSILSSTITIYCGLYYLTQQLDEVLKLVLFVLIVGVNLYFLYAWSVNMFEAGIEILAKRSNFIRRYFVKKARDGFSDDIFDLREEQSHVIGKENEKFYSLVQTVRKRHAKRERYERRSMRELFLDVINYSIEQGTIDEVSLENEEDVSEVLNIVAVEHSEAGNDRFDNREELSIVDIKT